MSLRDQLLTEYNLQTSGNRDGETTIGGETVTIGESQTVQSLSDSFLVSGGNRGVPRGQEAFEARQIARTQPMQLILNAIVDQLTGGVLEYPADEDELDDEAAAVRDRVDDVLTGPHLDGADFDDLIAAAVADMVGPGNAYFEVLPPADGAGNVSALKPIDPLTVRHNVDETRTPLDPPYLQAPYQTLSGDIVTAGDASPTELEDDDIVVMSYPGSYRSDRIYPLSPALQMKQWLEILADSTTHHGRFYSDNELPPGILSAREATQQDLDQIKEEVQAAKGDPRAAPVVGTDARWVEVGGSAVDLDVIAEQKWFMSLVAAAFGIPKNEIGFDEDVNRSTSEAQLQIVAKRVSDPLSKAIVEPLRRQLLPQFNRYEELGEPFDIAMRFNDPRQERSREEHLRDRWRSGVASLGEVRGALGFETDDTTIEIGGQELDWSKHPKPVLESLLIDARSNPEPGAETPETNDMNITNET
jgi:hypothetical protein